MLQIFALFDLPSHMYGPNLIFVFFSSAEADLAVQEQAVNVMHHGVNPLPVGLGGNNSLALL